MNIVKRSSRCGHHACCLICKWCAGLKFVVRAIFGCAWTLRVPSVTPHFCTTSVVSLYSVKRAICRTNWMRKPCAGCMPVRSQITAVCPKHESSFRAALPHSAIPNVDHRSMPFLPLSSAPQNLYVRLVIRLILSGLLPTIPLSLRSRVFSAAAAGLLRLSVAAFCTIA